MSAGSIVTRDISRAEFVALIAALMAVDALAIDIMLPALPNMGDALGVANANDRSLVLTSFLLGFGLPQLVFGPLSDRFGRRAPILIGLTVYVFTALSAPWALSFALLLGLRFVQGVAAASVRVAMLSAVRDRYSGKAMADIMSLVFAIFLLVPIFMPAVGQLILLVGSWRLVFVVMGLMAGVVALWTLVRLPETLEVERRRTLDFKSVAEGFAMVFTNRIAFWYGLSGTFLIGGILGFLNTAQPIYVGIFKLGVFFPLAWRDRGRGGDRIVSNSSGHRPAWRSSLSARRGDHLYGYVRAVARLQRRRLHAVLALHRDDRDVRCHACRLHIHDNVAGNAALGQGRRHGVGSVRRHADGGRRGARLFRRASL
jgi:DHA1 family bicyclomycin/chloramphenicol resistance-like MFS transporter